MVGVLVTEERWVLMSEETFNDMRFGFDLNVDRVAEAVHSRPPLPRPGDDRIEMPWWASLWLVLTVIAGFGMFVFWMVNP